ncbi:MAG TPA: PAS domain S-box protein [Prolixibacteraceae bacterium]|nr:PAS domain S-box protein [Prolixibacteraceae bacterium]
MTLNFYDVFDIQEYQNIQDLFSINMGIGSITTLPSGKPITLPSNFCDLCDNYIRKSKKGRSNCFKCNAEIGKPDSSGPIIKQCVNGKGLWNAGVSIVVNGNHIANWCIGQVKNEYVDEPNFLQFAEEIGVNKEDFKKAFDNVPYMTKERFTQVANILYLFVNQYAEKACKNLMLKQQLQEIKNTNEMLFRSQRRYRLLFEQSNDAIFVVKLPEGEYIDANESALKLTGRTHDEIIQLRTKDLTPQGAEKRLTQYIGGKSKDKSYKVDYLKPDGSVRQAKLSLIPIDQNSLYGIAQDITEQIKATEALKHSHDLMQYVIEHNRSAIAVHDKELKYIYVSQRYLEEYGIKENQIIGKHHYEVFPDLPQKWRDVHQKALNGIISCAEEDPYEKKDGSIDWTRWECRPWYDQNSEIGGIIVYTEVITERKKMEISLREREEKYKFLFYNNPQPSWIYDLESLAFIEVNEAAILHYGYTKEEFLSMNLKDIRPQEDIPKLLEDIHNKISPEYNNSEQWRHLKKNGEIIYVNISSHAMEYLGKQARHVLINDITDKVKTEQGIREALEKATESDRLKSAFLANMSHEIRTPLNSLLGFSELLIDPAFTELDKKEFIETMKLSENRLLTLIDDIVDLSKMEAGQIQIDKHSFLLRELITTIHRSHCPEAEKKGLELVFNKSGLENQISMTSDRARITQILNKLMGNAIKFTEKGSIELGLHILEDSIQFYVKDTGIGIAKEFHTRVFERFWQVDSGLKRKYEGSGIGLTVAKNLVELLGGNIGLDSTVDVGSTFYFTIPTMTND